MGLLRDYMKRIGLKRLKIILIVLVGLLVLFALVFTLFYRQRNAFLAAAIRKAKERALADHGLNISLGKAYFSGFSKVTFEQFRLIPKDRDQLLGIDFLDVDLKFWPLLSGKVKIFSVNMHDAALSLTKQDSLSNYDFLFRKKSEDTTKVKAKFNLAELSDGLINSV